MEAVETKVCGFCEQSFSRPVGISDTSWQQRQFCSKTCSSRISRLGRFSDVHVPEVKVCVQCGERFGRPADLRTSPWLKRMYCSVSCARRAVSQRDHARRPQRTCPICGDTFKARNGNSIKQQTTCGSDECKRRYKREIAADKQAATARAQYAAGRKAAKGLSPREVILWPMLIEHGWQWRVRWTDAWGTVEIDFAHPERKLAVEIDGPEHFHPGRRARDQRRDAELTRQGWTLHRFTNAEVDADPAAVAARILAL